VLTKLCRILAPFTPFLTEEIYTNLTGEESVHLADWPEVSHLDQSSNLLQQMEMVRQIVELGHAQRKEKSVKLRQPLAALSYSLAGERLEKPFEELVAKELNVKKVEHLGKAADLQVEFDFNLTPELIEEGLVRELVRQIQDLRKQSGCGFDQRVKVYYQAEERVESLIEKHSQELEGETLSDLIVSKKAEGLAQKTFEVGESSVWIGIKNQDDQS